MGIDNTENCYFLHLVSKVLSISVWFLIKNFRIPSWRSWTGLGEKNGAPDMLLSSLKKKLK